MTADGGPSSVEAELEELQRRYRIMEGDRKAYAEEVQNVLRKQRSHIEKLAKENLSLKQELSLETRAAAMGGAVRLSSQINKMTESGDSFARRIELERQRTSQLEEQLRQMHDLLLKQRTAMGGIYAPAESDSAVEKQVRVLENRLDKSLIKFNEGIAGNKEMRETIDNLRRERIVFDQLYKKLQRELAEKKRSMAEIIEQANVAYEERDKLQAVLARMKASSEAEARDFESEWKSLGETLDHDLRVHEVLSRELQKRAEAVAVGESDVRGSLTLADEVGLRSKVRKQTWGLAKDRTAVQGSLEQTLSFEQAFAQIQESTGISDIDELVRRFISAEDDNFSRFNFVNELNLEVDKAEETLAELRTEMDRYRGTDRGADTQRRKLAKELEAKVRLTEAKTEALDARWRAASALIAQLGEAVDALCARIGCNMAFLKEVGGEEGVGEANMMVYLGVIEQRTNELLRLHASQQAAKEGSGARKAAERLATTIGALEGDEHARTFLTSGAPLSARGLPGSGGATAMASAMAASMAVAVPSTSLGEGEEDEEDSRPLTRDELKARTVRGLARKGEAHQAGASASPAAGKRSQATPKRA